MTVRQPFSLSFFLNFKHSNQKCQTNWLHDLNSVLGNTKKTAAYKLADSPSVSVFPACFYRKREGLSWEKEFSSKIAKENQDCQT